MLSYWVVYTITIRLWRVKVKRAMMTATEVRNSNCEQCSVNGEGWSAYWPINSIISCTALVGECLNFHISPALFSSLMFIVAVMKNFSAYEVRRVGKILSSVYFPPCLPWGEGCCVRPTLSGETADGEGRRENAVVASDSTERESTPAKQLLIMEVTAFVYIFRAITCHTHTHTHKRKMNRGTLDPRRAAKHWWG